MTEAELVEAAGVLADHAARREAREARDAVMERLERLGYEVLDDDDDVDEFEVEDEYDERAPEVPLVETSASRKNVPGPDSIRLIRLTGALLIVVAAVVIWVSMAPDPVADRTDSVQEALVESTINEAGAEGAPQQAVVNGWVARDLLTVVASTTNEAARADQQAADRLAAEVALLAVAVAFGIATWPGRPA